jgi:hypothetical protein
MVEGVRAMPKFCSPQKNSQAAIRFLFMIDDLRFMIAPLMRL